MPLRSSTGVDPPGVVVGVYASEREAHREVAKRWGGVEDYVTVVGRGEFTWTVWVERDPQQAP